LSDIDPPLIYLVMRSSLDDYQATVIFTIDNFTINNG